MQQISNFKWFGKIGRGSVFKFDISSSSKVYCDGSEMGWMVINEEFFIWPFRMKILQFQ
jgi:hypothetical protein